MVGDAPPALTLGEWLRGDPIDQFEKGHIYVIDFWATWCGPCRMVAPVVDELAKEYAGRVTFAKLDVDQNPKTASSYGVMSIPTLLIFKEGKPVSQLVGFRPKEELKRSLDEVLGS